MVSYLIRRLLLFVPTLIGATAVIFLLMAMAPISIIDALLPPGGELLPGQRAARETYIRERYGLGSPPAVQYLRWLNNVSPVGFRIWRRADPEVVAAGEREREMREARRAELVAAGADKPTIDAAIRQVNASPSPGDFRFDKPGFKAPDLGESYIKSRPVCPSSRRPCPTRSSSRSSRCQSASRLRWSPGSGRRSTGAKSRTPPPASCCSPCTPFRSSGSASC